MPTGRSRRSKPSPLHKSSGGAPKVRTANSHHAPHSQPSSSPILPTEPTANNRMTSVTPIGPCRQRFLMISIRSLPHLCCLGTPGQLHTSYTDVDQPCRRLHPAPRTLQGRTRDDIWGTQTSPPFNSPSTINAHFFAVLNVTPVALEMAE